MGMVRRSRYEKGSTMSVICVVREMMKRKCRIRGAGKKGRHLGEVGVVEAHGEVHVVVVLEGKRPAPKRAPEVVDVGMEVEGVLRMSEVK